MTEIRTILSGYRTSGSFQSQPPAIGRPVPIVFNRTSDTTGSKPVLVLVVRLKTSDIVSNRTERLKTGHYIRFSDVIYIYITPENRI